MALIGNSGYVSLIMNVEKSQNIKYVSGQTEAFRKSKLFFKMLRNWTVKLSSFKCKKNIILKRPIYLGSHIIQLA